MFNVVKQFVWKHVLSVHSAIIQARCLFVKLSMALLVESYGSWSHINCKTFHSSVLWLEMKYLVVFKHNSPDVIKLIIKRINVLRL